MLELVNVPENARHTAFVYHGAGSTTHKKGTFYVLSGTYTQALIDNLPAGQKNAPGYAEVGSLMLVPAYGANDPAFPATKYDFQVENDDDSLDTIANGASVTYFTAGRFRTSEFTSLDNSPDFGDYLKTSASGTVTEESTLHTKTDASVAKVINLISAVNVLDYELLPSQD